MSNNEPPFPPNCRKRDPGSPCPCYLVDNSKTDVYDSYFELTLDDWSEPLDDLIVGRRIFAASSGGDTQYAILASCLIGTYSGRQTRDRLLTRLSKTWVNSSNVHL